MGNQEEKPMHCKVKHKNKNSSLSGWNASNLEALKTLTAKEKSDDR